MLKKNVIIIEPSSSPAYLSESLKELGFNTIALYTVPMAKRDEYYRFGPELFDQQLCVEGKSLQEVIAIVNAFEPIYILNGKDNFAPVTDAIMQALLPEYANNPATSEGRHNKFHMQEALKAHGLPYIQQIRVARKDIGALDLNTLRFPCFCKPVEGSSTKGGFKANNADEFMKEIQQYTKPHQLGEADYLIQEYIEGEEYVVDSFSHQGKHYISSIQKYQKRMIEATPTYGYCEVVNDKAIWESCADFVKQCLDATGLKNGFCHTEIFALKDGTYRLIEVNPRISGIKGYYNKLAKLLGLKTQPELMAECLKGTPKESTFEHKKGHGRFLCLYHFSEQQLRDPGDVLSPFESVQYYQLLKPIGTIANRNPKNLSNTDLLVMLAHDDINTVNKDSISMFELEKTGMLL